MGLWTKLGVTTAAGVFALGCANETAPSDGVLDDSALEIEQSTLSEQTEGWGGDGWSFNPFGSLLIGTPSLSTWGIYFSRTSGSATRGGGACLVWKKTGSGSTCSGITDDATCTGTTSTPNTARYRFGSSAEGYCYQNTCYHRPGADTTYCYKNPSNTPGYKYGSPASRVDEALSVPTGGYSAMYVLGCMTKEGQPGNSCGFGAPITYWRGVQLVNINTPF